MFKRCEFVHALGGRLRIAISPRLLANPPYSIRSYSSLLRLVDEPAVVFGDHPVMGLCQGGAVPPAPASDPATSQAIP